MASSESRRDLIDTTMTELVIFILFVCFLGFSLSWAPPGTKGIDEVPVQKDKTLVYYSCLSDKAQKTTRPMYDVTVRDDSIIDIKTLPHEFQNCSEFLSVGEDGQAVWTLEDFKAWVIDAADYTMQDGNCFGRPCHMYANVHICSAKVIGIPTEIANRGLRVANISEYSNAVAALNRGEIPTGCDSIILVTDKE